MRERGFSLTEVLVALLLMTSLSLALLKKQWAQNLSKFNNVQLLGGVTMNGEKLYSDAERELEAIEKQLRDEYELPPLGLIG
jgi:prepilin-type N-terminal cleavage/methylation domain-containing protein